MVWARDAVAPVFADIMALLADLRRERGRTDGLPRRPRFDKDAARVSLVIARDLAGRLLLGRRRDNGRWTLPGGHLERGEPAIAAAARELLEETGMLGGNLQHLETRTIPSGMVVYLCTAQVAGEASGARDPDEECSEWRFFELPLPAEVLGNLHGPRDRAHNVVFSIPGAAPHLDARSPGGGAIGTGRAAQLGRKQAERDTRKAAATAREVDRELASGSEQGRRAAALIDKAARTFADQFKPEALFNIVNQFGKATDRHARLELDKQLRGAIGVPLSAIEKPHRDKLEEWAAANVDLIVTLPDRYFDDIRLRVEDAFSEATHPATLADELREAYGISENNAERIARDQVLSLQSDLNRERMTSLGVTRYFWRSVEDGRVRENHADLAARSLAGETFAFNDPPLGGGTDETETGNPGDGILCRCYPEPVLDQLLGDV